jgi:uncharacterized protein YndB with AHSA1/START domain
VPTARRSRTIAAPPQDLWELISDPHHLPRWWPRVARVESVEPEAFTEVLASPRGRLVRADFEIVRSDAQALVLRWNQRIEGTPFARLLTASETELRLEPLAQPPSNAPAATAAPAGGELVGGAATIVTIELRQSLRGFFAHLGMGRVRRAAQATLDDALSGLERIVG